MSPRLTVAMPVYRPVPELLETAIESVARAVPRDAEVIVFPNGREAIEDVGARTLPEGWSVRQADPALDLVANWNRCLAGASGELVHIMHSDDVVHPAYYDAIFALKERYPAAGVFATTTWAVGLDPPDVAADGPHGLLEGVAAARFFLEDERHACGNVVVSASAIDALGPFVSEYSDCPDEEAFLRWAAHGGLALDERPLYGLRSHPVAYRNSSWASPGFARRFVLSRRVGAAALLPDAPDVYRDSTVRRTISIAVSLAIGGRRTDARRVLRDLVELEPSCASSKRVLAARASVALPGGPTLLRLQRRLRTPEPTYYSV